MSGTAKALVLDFGGVVTRTMFETHAHTERVLGLPGGTLTWRGPFDPDSDPLWRRMQAGEVSERDYWLTRTAETGHLIGEEWSRMEQFIGRVRSHDPEAMIRPEARAAIRAAKDAGRRVAVLSNELDLMYGAELRRNLDLFALFDTVVDATHTRILKPDPRAYRAVLDELGLAAADCVFVDDQERNVVGARAVGMCTVLFDVLRPRASYDDALNQLGLAAL